MHHQTLVVALALVAGLPAQNPFHGSGVPGAYVSNTPGLLGATLTLNFGSPTTPVPIALLALSDGLGPIPVPGFGTIGLDLFSPAYQLLVFGIDGSGNGSASATLPPGFPLPNSPPLFAHAATLEVAGLSISKTVRIDWMLPNAWEAVPPLATARQMHTATALGDGPRDNVTEVLICGGATGSIIVPTPLASAELFEPLTRTVTPLPNLSLPRSGHRALRLADGRILITGGVTTGGLVTATCEFFDAATLQFVPAPTMTTGRSGHALTLLDDGRVLATGGVSDWQNTSTNFIGALNTAQNTAEVFDPNANAWSPLPNMAQKRLGHSQTKLLDGRVLVAAGIRGGYIGANGGLGGGQIPQYTDSCELFDPISNTFAPTGVLQHFSGIQPLGTNYVGRAFQGASVLPSGDVLLTGGFVASQATIANNDVTIVTNFSDRWSPATGLWSVGPDLPSGMAYHGHERHGNGALLCGGFAGDLSTLATTGAMLFHDGVNVTTLAPIAGGGRGAHSLTRLHDGTLLVYGGGAWPATLGDGWIYAPN